MITNKYSEEWTDLMNAEIAFRKSVGHYNKTTSPETKKKDILLSLEDRMGRLITTRLMSKGYIKTEVIEQVWDKLVYLVFYGEQSVASWAIDSLLKIPYDKRNNYKEEIIRLCLIYAEKDKHEEITLKFGLELLYELGYKDAVLQYLEKYKEHFNLNEEDIVYYQNAHE